jgi:hypothetical protein
VQKRSFVAAFCLILTGCFNDSPTLVVSNIMVDEGQEARLRVALSKKSPYAVSVNYVTQQGTAQEGTDYTKRTGQLNFSPGETEKYVRLRTITSGTYQPKDKKLFVAFSKPSNLQLSDRRVTVSITNQIEPVITIDKDQLSVDAGAEVELIATLSRPSAIAVTAKCLITDISESTETVIEDAVMRFEPGESNKKIKIPTKIDNTNQLKKNLRIELSKPQQATLSDSVIANVTVKRPQQIEQKHTPEIVLPAIPVWLNKPIEPANPQPANKGEKAAKKVDSADKTESDKQNDSKTNNDLTSGDGDKVTGDDGAAKKEDTSDKGEGIKSADGNKQKDAQDSVANPSNKEAAPSQPEQTPVSELDKTTDEDDKGQDGDAQQLEPANKGEKAAKKVDSADKTESDKQNDSKTNNDLTSGDGDKVTGDDGAAKKEDTSDKGEGIKSADGNKQKDAQETVADQPDLPEDEIKITVSYSNPQVNEGRKVIANVTLDQKPEPQQQVIVEYQAVADNDSVTAGEDFKSTFGQLIFNADNYLKSQQIEVRTYYNLDNENQKFKTFKIEFSKAVSYTSSNETISIKNNGLPQKVDTLNFKIKEFDKIKTLSFEWVKYSDASYYRLLEKLKGKKSYLPVARIDDTNTSSYEYTPALIALVGATYVLEACVSDNQCVWSNPVETKRLINKGIGYFKASNVGKGDLFGHSVSLSADGKTLAVGAWQEASDQKGILSGTEIDSRDIRDSDLQNKNTGAVYIFLLKNNVWAQQAYITPENVGSKDYFGYSVSLSANGDTLAVGATREDSHASKRTKFDNDRYITNDDRDYADLSEEERKGFKNHGYNSGAVYIFNRLDNKWQESHFIKPDSVEIGAKFGTVVDLSADGKTLAVGARHGGGDEKRHGTAYIFSLKKTEWTQDQIFAGENKQRGDDFGFAVDLSGNGKVLAVGAYTEEKDLEEYDKDINNNGGVAYIFRQNSNGTWPAAYERRFVGQKQTGYFGHAVGLNYQGDILAIGARGEVSGAVYIYTYRDPVWSVSKENPLKASNGDLRDSFGASLSFSDDGTQLLVGASGESSGASGIYSQQDSKINDKAGDNSLYGNGAAYLFVLSGSTWQQKAYIKPARHQENISKDGATEYGEYEHDYEQITGYSQRFGGALSLSGDGQTLAIGAAQEQSEFKGISSGKQDSQQTNDKYRSGAVYVY